MRTLVMLLVLASGATLAAEETADRQINFGLKVAQKGLWQEARFRFERAVKADPQSASALNNLAVSLEQMGEFAGARKAYEKALELKPDFVDAEVASGCVLEDLGRPAEAVECYRRALGINPNYAEVYGNWYGTPKHPSLDHLAAGKDVLLEIDFQGAMQVRYQYADALLIFILPPDEPTLLQRLTDRGRDTIAWAEGGWTVRQVVHHVADSHMNGYIRMKMALTENKPLLKPYVQDEWVKLADSASLAVDDSLHIIRALHHRWSVLLKSLSDESWERNATHPEIGEMSVDDLLEDYAHHGKSHLKNILSARRHNNW
jgi:tetratricopeptide (TPR) repeat protein